MTDSKEFKQFVTSANDLKEELVSKNRIWEDSPLLWIKLLAPGTKGKLGKRLISQWCGLHGLEINKSENSQADMMINRKKIEVKFSMLWEDGTYTFEQIRDQDYQYLICLGISPHEAHCWIIRKDIAWANATPQHTGGGGQETKWFSVKPDDPPSWLANKGGSLMEALVVLKKL
jgi:hypothetical protein